MAQRMYWSPMDARRRVKYTLAITGEILIYSVVFLQMSNILIHLVIFALCRIAVARMRKVKMARKIVVALCAQVCSKGQLNN